MKNSLSRRVLTVSAGVIALALPLAACSGGGSGDASDGGKTEITYLTQSDDAEHQCGEGPDRGVREGKPRHQGGAGDPAGGHRG